MDVKRFFLYVPGMPFDGGTFSLQSLGGSESAGYYVARELATRGHEVFMFTETHQGGIFDGVRYCPIGQRTPKFPRGNNFETACASVPHDVLIMQRTAGAFVGPSMSKLRLWWAHDLAWRSQESDVKAGWWNCHGAFAVSEFHAAQLRDVYMLPTDFVSVLRNAVPQDPFKDDPDVERKLRRKLMVYSSRPERGLEHLVGEGGVMERLAASPRSDVTLAVCAYDDTVPQLASLYQRLWARCRELPNVVLLGALTKAQLYELWRAAWLHVYPVVSPAQFEEVSCITVMEAQVSGTPVLACANGALPETLDGGGHCLLDYEDGSVPVDKFVGVIRKLEADAAGWRSLSRAARAKGVTYRWADSVDSLLALVEHRFAVAQEPYRVVKHLLRYSDVYAAQSALAIEATISPWNEMHPLSRLHATIDQRYAFRHGDGLFEKHYRSIARYAANTNNHHNLGTDLPLQMERVREVLPHVEALALRGGGRVLDYGCCNGAVTVALARRFPNVQFTGMELAQENIDELTTHLAVNPLLNLTVRHANALGDVRDTFDLVLAMEVVEHQPNFARLVDMLEATLRLGGRLVLTFSTALVESTRSSTEKLYEHLHHLEPLDIKELWGKKENMRVDNFSWNEVTPAGDSVGGTVVTWTRPERRASPPTGAIDYVRKLRGTRPLQSLSVCMIVKAGEPSLERALLSVSDIADQIVAGVDDPGRVGDAWSPEGTVTVELLKRYGVEWFSGDSPLKVGFDAARNATLDRAWGDWVLWLDADEELQYAERLPKFLQQHNPYEAYSVQHVHVATEPAGLLELNYPCRLFRRDSGLRFFGVVHEHPSHDEQTPPGHSMLLPDSIAVLHTGYATQAKRQQRFSRNAGLMLRDIQAYPKRQLSQLMWLRDCTYLARLAAVANERDTVLRRCHEALEMWRNLVRAEAVHYVLEGLRYVTECSTMLHGAQGVLRWRFAHDLFHGEIGNHELIEAALPSVEDARALTDMIVNDRYKPFSQRYR